MRRPIQLVVVEDHPVTRQGFISMLRAFDDQFVVIAEAANGQEALLKVQTLQPDVVVTDLHFAPGDPSDGIDLVKALCEQHPQVRVVMITGELDDQYLLLAHDAGANAYLSKHAAAGEIAKAIDAVASGFTHFPARLRDLLAQRANAPRLTDRESQLVPLIAQGLTAKEIARELSRLQPSNPIIDRTVEIHKGNIKRKFGLNSAQALLAFCIQNCKTARRTR